MYSTALSYNLIVDRVERMLIIKKSFVYCPKLQNHLGISVLSFRISCHPPERIIPVLEPLSLSLTWPSLPWEDAHDLFVTLLCFPIRYRICVSTGEDCMLRHSEYCRAQQMLWWHRYTVHVIVFFVKAETDNFWNFPNPSVPLLYYC